MVATLFFVFLGLPNSILGQADVSGVTLGVISKMVRTVAWRRFVTSMEALPPDQAAPLWQAAQVQAIAALAPPAVLILTTTNA
jgi:hypothetical protein